MYGMKIHGRGDLLAAGYALSSLQAHSHLRGGMRCVLTHLAQHAGDDAMGGLYDERELGEGSAPCQGCACAKPKS